MKIKQYLYITDPQDYLDGGENCFHISDNNSYAGKRYFEEWILAGKVEIEVLIGDKDIKKHMLGAIEVEETNERASFQVKMDKLEVRREKLLALVHNPK